MNHVPFFPCAVLTYSILTTCHTTGRKTTYIRHNRETLARSLQCYQLPIGVCNSLTLSNSDSTLGKCSQPGFIHILVGPVHAQEVQSKVAIKITYSRATSLACFPCLRSRAHSKGFIIEDSDIAGISAGGTREGDRAGLGESPSVISIVLCRSRLATDVMIIVNIVVILDFEAVDCNVHEGLNLFNFTAPPRPVGVREVAFGFTG